jgi:N-acyl-D-aspartate/D-glutamate deacylase
MMEFDMRVRGGTIVDGTRVPRFRGDLWIKDGRIAQIGGRPRGVADRVIDAEGLIVAPGFVDAHTHYDAQIRWDPWCSISSWHGVTSLVLGNCGFGFAPCRSDFRERSMLTMTRVEAIPYASMKAGMVWDWETIPEYLESLEATPKGVNCIQYMPTASLMTYVMGLEAAKTRPATGQERKEMQRLLHEGMDAGLCGFSIQRMGVNSIQTDYDGTPMVTDTMEERDVLALCEVLAERDEGSIQIDLGFENVDANRAFVEKMAAVARRPILYNLVTANPVDPSVHQETLAWLDATNERGLRIFGQAATGRPGFAFALADWNMYDTSPAWNHATTGTKDEKIAKLSDPALRPGLRASIDETTSTLRDTRVMVGGPIRNLVVQGVNHQPDLASYVGKSVGQIAEEEGKHVVDVLIDLSLAGDLNVEFLGPELGRKSGSVDNIAAVIKDSLYTFPGVSDGGAHTKFFNGGTYTTDLLLWLVREKKKLTLEEAHYRLSALPARAAGMHQRGTLREGAPADVVVYDLDSLAVNPHWVGDVAYDYPGGEWRRVHKAEGYKAILVNGEVTFEDGECTGSTPGKLLRYGRG